MVLPFVPPAVLILLIADLEEAVHRCVDDHLESELHSAALQLQFLHFRFTEPAPQ
jgi:hypothetical protein